LDNFSKIKLNCNNHQQFLKNFCQEESASKNCQILRSASHWSFGIEKNNTEKSIQKAYLDMINKAEHFIYIENQYFITGNVGEPVINDIGEALINKLVEKIKEKVNFLVLIAMPLMPGSEGKLTDNSGGLLRVIMGYEYYSLFQGSKSIWTKLKEHTDEPGKYFRVFGLRNHGVTKSGNPVES